jgi:hypothetical protein
VENEQQAAEMAKKCLLYFQGPLANEKKRVKKADKKAAIRRAISKRPSSRSGQCSRN